MLGEETYHRIGALVGDRVLIKEPVALDFTLDELTKP
jgi:hypothetical protein